MRPTNLGGSTVNRCLRDIIRWNLESNDRQLAKAFPIAYPIVDVAYDVRQRIPEPIGLVARYALETLCQFGPCSPVELDGFLALGVDLAQVVLERLAILNSDVKRVGERFEAGPGTLERARSGFLGREVRHQRKFVVNGLTGMLLPINFWDTNETWRLTIDPNSPNGPMRDALGELTAIFSLISDVMADGLADLKRHLGSTDVEARRNIGIPEGAIELLSNQPQETEVGWVLAFLLVRTDGSVDIVTAADSSLSILDDATRHKEYLGRICRRLAKHALDAAIDEEAIAKQFDEWPQGVSAFRVAGGDSYCVYVDDPEKLLWLHDDAMDLAGDEGGEQVAKQGSKACRWLARALVEGTYWVRDCGTIIRLVAGNRGTATHVCLLRGLEALRVLVAKTDLDETKPPPIDLVSWWSQWQESVLRGFPSDIRPEILHLDVLLELADRIPNTEFLAKLEWFASVAARGAKRGL